jgi:hypothetical protein
MKNRKAVSGLAAMAAAAHAFAAGGHFEVDHARIEAAGECGNESWFSRGTEGAHLVHLGFKCGTGALELGASGESSRGERLAGPQPSTWTLGVNIGFGR